MSFTVDIEGARAKVNSMKNLGRAGAYQLTAFGAKAVLAVKTAGILNTRSGHLMRNIGMKVDAETDRTQLVVGTGVGRAKSVKYARIHDEGGEIRPKNAKMLTIPLAGVKGRAANFGPDLFIKKVVTDQLLLCRKNPKRGFRALFLLVPKVTIPGRRWFSRPLDNMRPELEAMLSPETLWEIAQKFGLE